MTHWEMLNKGNSNLVALFNMTYCVICSPVWRFVPRDRSAAKGPLGLVLQINYGDALMGKW